MSSSSKTNPVAPHFEADIDPPVMIFLEDEAAAPRWNQRLGEFDPPPFVARSCEEADIILGECDMLGTPMGLVVIGATQVSPRTIETIRHFRQRRTDLDLPILVATKEATREGLIDALHQGANNCYLEPLDWDFFSIDARKRMANAHRASGLRSDKAHVESVLAQHRDSILSQDLWRLDLASRTLEFSSHFEDLIGYESHELSHNLDEWLELIHPSDLHRLSMALADTNWQAAPEEISFEFRLRHRTGAWRWVLMRGRIERNDEGVPMSISGAHTDITRAKTTDNITGLANRFQFEDWLHAYSFEEIEQGDLAVFMLGIDRFTLIRDSMGQDLADQVLRVVGERLEELLVAANCIGKAGIVARLSRDEFGVCVPGMAEREWAETFARRIKEVLSKGIWLDGRQLFVTTSIGYVIGSDSDSNRTLWRDAQISLHNAKAAGGNRIIPFDAAMRDDVVERMMIENDLKRALEEWEFEIYYQPKVTLSQERIIGFEALIRWRHPEKGIIPPNQFIPMAEANGLIIPIGTRLLREACQKLRQWQIAFPNYPPLELSVNLSVIQFRDPNLIAEVKKVLEDTSIPAESLKFEVTESVLVDDPEGALAIVQQLRSLGVGLKIDDFGTGYSSLSYLHRLPFETLKIDRSFISSMSTDHSAYEIVRAIVALAQNLGLHVVAEGVENRAQLEELKNLGCAYGQGYLFAPPLNEDAAFRLLQQQDQPMAVKAILA